MIHSRMVWMFLPVERSITVSAPQRIAQTSLSTSSATDDVTIELPILALILTRKLRPMIIGSLSGWLILAGEIVRPRAPPPLADFRGEGTGAPPPTECPVRTPAVRCLFRPSLSRELETFVYRT